MVHHVSLSRKAFGDPDAGDEFVVDIYHDPIFHNFVFNTVAGRSRCRYEDNTIAAEQPDIKIVSYPSQFIFPNDSMEFEVDFYNIGEHVYSYFLISQDTGDDGSFLKTMIDNTLFLSYYGTDVILYKDKPMRRKLRVFRGPDEYSFKPVQLTLKSRCEQDMNKLIKTVTKPLYNSVDSNGTQSLKWLEPCPEIEWASTIKRDRKFLLNTKSEDQDFLPVVVFNPSASKSKTLKSLVGNRLEHVYLFYREQGENTWRNAKNESLLDVDFAQDPIEEDFFGYAKADWLVGNGLLADGTYEIVVESRCTDVGGPEEFSFNREEIITGVIDLSNPEQYGQALPLREEIIVGEEMKIVFTENLDCSTPLSFDIELRVPTLDKPLNKREGLFVICEGRTISVQVDLTVGIDPEQILGQPFEIEIGAIGETGLGEIRDVNGNPTVKEKGNIKFSRRFGMLDLSKASTSFDFEMRNLICTEKNTDELMQDATSAISSRLDGTPSDAIQVKSVHCLDVNTGVASVELNPTREDSRDSGGKDAVRRLKGNLNSFNLFKQIQSADVAGENGRRLSSMAQANLFKSVRIIPHSDDMKNFVTKESDRKEEEFLYYLSSLKSNGHGHYSKDSRALAETANHDGTTIEDGVKNVNSESSHVTNEIEALKRELELERMENKKDKEEDREQMADLMRELKESRSEDMSKMYMLQVGMVVLGCVAAAVAMYSHFSSRSRKA